jgi:ABC-type histidine transport system ATPase subunit
LRHRERRAALARASTLLQQLATCVRPLAAEDPELVTESLQILFDWIARERAMLGLPAL